MNITRNDLEYPLNLIADVFGDDDIIEKADEISDFEGSVEYALYTFLSERERQILKYRYAERLTLTETARRYDVTHERIRQIEAKALRKLRHPSANKYFTHGIKAEIQSIREYYFNHVAELEEKLITLCKLNEKAADKVITDMNLRKKYKPASEKIENLGLSCRSYNCLMRAGYDTVGKVAGLTRDELSRVRNLGEKCTDEIIEKLEEYGCKLKGTPKETEAD